MGMREPTYGLTLRFSRKHGYTTVDHESRSLVPGGMKAVAAEIDPDKTRQRELVSDWEAKERSARALGGSLELYRRGDDGVSAASSPGGRFGAIARRNVVFGRKH